MSKVGKVYTSFSSALFLGLLFLVCVIHKSRGKEEQFKAMISAETSSEWLVYGLLVGEELPHQREDGYRVDPFAVTITGHIPKILLLLHMLNWLNQVIQRLYMYQAISFTLDLSVPYVVKSVGA